jgi:Tfp pilus assembly protein PilO
MKEKLAKGGWVVTIPVSLMALAYVTLFFLPRMRAISDVRQQLRQREDFISQADKLQPTNDRVAKELHETQEYCETWRSRAVDERQLEALFSKIGQLAEGNGARILRFEPQPAVTHARLRTIPILFNFSAPFASVQQLARGLEELPASIWVDHLKIENADQDGKSVKVEMKLVLFADNPEKSD